MAQSWWHFQNAGYPATLLGSGQFFIDETAIEIELMLTLRDQGAPSRLRAVSGIHQELFRGEFARDEANLQSCCRAQHRCSTGL